MKTILLILVLVTSLNCYCQKIFTDSNGRTFEIKELGYKTIDSCLSIAKRNPGWCIPDTTQFREIYNEWFGDSHKHLIQPKSMGGAVQRPYYEYDIKGGKFFSLTKYDENSYTEVRMNDKFSIYVAEGNTGWGTQLAYSLILIRQITDTSEIVSQTKQMQIETNKGQQEFQKSESENLYNPIDKNTELALNKVVQNAVKLKNNDFLYTNWIIHIDKEGLITDAYPDKEYKGGHLIDSYIDLINKALINQKVRPFVDKNGSNHLSYSKIYINITVSKFPRKFGFN